MNYFFPTYLMRYILFSRGPFVAAADCMWEGRKLRGQLTVCGGEAEGAADCVCGGGGQLRRQLRGQLGEQLRGQLRGHTSMCNIRM